MEFREKISNLGIDLSRIRGREGDTQCPKCSHTRKKKKAPCLHVHILEGWWRCHHCDWKGSVKFDDKAEKKVYVRPKLDNQTDCSDDIVKWFSSRGIGQMALNKMQVKSGITWMPQTQKEEYCIQFNYVRDGEVINIKHRDGFKNFRLEKDAELIFYGLDNLKDTDKYIVIVEGEMDQLSFIHAGIDYVISVPNGASSKGNVVLEYLDNSLSYFENTKKIILALDNDEPGMVLREELSRRFGKDRCFKVDFKDKKDANEYLVAYGEDKLREVILSENLIEYPINGVVEVDDVWDRVNHIFDNGLPKGVKTGIFRELDDLITYDSGKLCVLTGVPNSGKSPFVDMVATSLAIRHGWRWGICSMETKPVELHIAKITEKIIGRLIRPGNKVDDSQRQRVKNFMSDHMYFIESNYENNESDTIDFILDAAKGLVRRYGIKGLVIDPWNKIEHDRRNGETENDYVSRILDKIIRFAQNNGVFVFLIAHPTKMPKEGKKNIATPTLYDVSGSSNFFNKPDWGVSVHINYETGLTEVTVNKAKWDHLGAKGVANLRYNGGNTRLGEPTDKLDFSNWLDTLPSIQDHDDDDYVDPDDPFINSDGSVPDKAPFDTEEDLF